MAMGRRVQAPGMLARLLLYTRLASAEIREGVRETTTSTIANMVPEHTNENMVPEHTNTNSSMVKTM